MKAKEAKEVEGARETEAQNEEDDDKDSGDGDDFIEVRSKRQMLNDRREQREKEIKAKSRMAKVVMYIELKPFS